MAEFPIVGIGSSAGGLEAQQTLFRAMPADSGLAFIVAAHLDPTQKSHLSELLGRCTPMPVVQIDGPIKIEPNHVYVIAPDQELTIREGVIQTNRPTAPRGQRHPVDSFFHSLAEDQGERAIAIVLSGTGSNGSLGLRFIKAEGGIVIAQEPETAGFQGMPRSAIGTGLVDLTLPPEKMPEALLNLARHSYLNRPAASLPAEGEAGEAATLGMVLSLVRVQTGQDFRGYKERTLLRRIHRRMGLHRLEGMSDYVRRLRGDPEELAALARDLTINVTGFFRDPEAWQALDEAVIKPLVEERQSGTAIRVWVPGCSTGEEAYTIAMLVAERAEAARKSFDLRIFATDVAQAVLTSARGGIYPASIEAGVTPERLQRFFKHDDDHYRVKQTLRETITFAPQNVLQDPPFSRLDLVSCRNFLIYLEPELQKRVLALFHFSLREGGHMFLGTAETVHGRDELFDPVSKKWRIFRRSGPTRHDVVDFPLLGSGDLDLDVASSREAVAKPRAPAREVIDRELLERYAPASVLIDRQQRIQYLRGPVDDYLRTASGEPSLNLLTMARQGLQAPLRAAIRQAAEGAAEVTSHARVRRNGTFHPVRLVVARPRTLRPPDGNLLVTFFSQEAAPPTELPSVAADADDGRLQEELDATREDLRLTLEQMEASNEELKASNEEIRSINEELQASNEELETSKEELQSLNEELKTVNSQLQAKLEELEGRTDDLNNLLNGSDVPTLFLDRNLRIRWFTPSMKALLELLPTDLGRPIGHFAQKFTGGDLVEDATRVMATLAPADVEVVSNEGLVYLRRSVPYRTADDRIDGVVMSFTEITRIKRAEQDIQEAKLFAESIVDTVREPLVVLTAQLRVQSANDAFYQTFQVTREDTIGRLIYDLGNRQWDIPQLRRLLDEVLPTDKHMTDFEVEQTFEAIGHRTMLLNARQVDSVQLILLAIEDITDRKQAELALRASEQRLRDVLETDAVGVLFFDREGNLLDANHAFLQLTGYAQEDIASGALNWRALTPPEWIEPSEQQMERLERTGRIGPYEKEYFRKDGSRAWLLFAGRALDDGTLVEYGINIQDRKRAEADRELLTRELSHRVKNVFAVVQALATMTNARAVSATEYREAFLGRLHAMAAVQGLMLDSPWRGADLKLLVEQMLAPYRLDRLDGEAQSLTSEQCSSLGLVLHELATNAVKYGALSDPDGSLRISWRKDGTELRLRWQETGGPAITEPLTSGFGSELIDTVCRHQLHGRMERSYAPEGLVCELAFPVTE